MCYGNYAGDGGQDGGDGHASDDGHGPGGQGSGLDISTIFMVVDGQPVLLDRSGNYGGFTKITGDLLDRQNLLSCLS